MCSKTRKREFDVKVNVNESRRLYEIFRGQCAICASDYYCACVSFILCDCCDHLPRSASRKFFNLRNVKPDRGQPETFFRVFGIPGCERGRYVAQIRF